MFSTVNKPVERVDAYEKVTGRAKYGADLQFAGMLYGKVLRAKHPSARIKSINVEKARAIPGVWAVMTAQEVPCNEIGVIIKDQQVLAKERVYYIGDGVAMVAAESLDIAAKALEAIEVEYEEIEGIFDPLESKESHLIHPDRDSNEVVHHKLRKGNVEEGFAGSDVIIEREYETQFVEHSYIEPEAVVAVPHENGSLLTIYGSVQNVFATRDAVARCLKADLSKVRVVQNHIGGSFGGKDEVVSAMACRAALLALKTDRPVKMVNTREESILESYKRHPYKMKYKVGATKDGKLMAMEIEAIADGGAYACQTPFVTWRSVVQATGPYEVPNVKTDTYGYYTNNVYTGAMRGYGSPQVIFANESLMDELAQELGISPLEIRLKNILRNGSITASGQKLDRHEVSLAEVMKKAAEAIGYEKKYREYSKPQKGDKRRGIGMAISYRGCSLGAEAVDAAGTVLSIQKDGSVYLYSGLAENGQGLKTAFCQIAAEELGIEMKHITFLEANTLISPDSGSTVASRSTLVGGSSVMRAAESAKRALSLFLAEEFGLTSSDLVFKENWIYTPDGKKLISFAEAANKAFWAGVQLSHVGWYVAPSIHWDEEEGKGSPYFTYVYGCQIAEVEVDMGTGEVTVLNMAAAHDVGRAINPEMLKGQIYGGVMMGLGYGIMEEVETDEGYIANTNFDEYIIPTSKDMPNIIPIIVENPDPDGPFGAKSIGEPTLELGAAAIANAIAQATGRRIRSLPLNLERVLLGHPLRKGRGKK
ncbi:xanthine dehydrogenase family protein molybdopterin-binding subunit [Acetomicrobium hydrogeniformans]|uniref:Aldehyde oxidase and xanthine dehydrogenase, molybdopterin binding domain protein n=1 Tax=Acetomicrobium hydrogeniformans ATCC BAA-1850 TaxID=592015 RepID=A0A0T5X7S1_9BACT|nr:xanthine dehydrogenase family protein molybdopterin-binding subunit [Acetomicrobium hydrogeniformans]KRT34524.1 aldehyde oxidase and xanthine dehydrogenase, molybdopterin binding domain protein [Acetomicrobium hydrogeniformans ATCC BAA-1850]